MIKTRSKPVVVVDCNVLLQGLAFPGGPAASCIRLVEEGHVELVVSRSTLLKAKKVLNDPDVRKISTFLTDVGVAAFLERVWFRARVVRRIRRLSSLPRDPSDEIYLDLAVAAKADFLVTRDSDLLSLASSHATDAKEFRSRTHPLLILDPVAFLKAIERLASDQP